MGQKSDRNRTLLFFCLLLFSVLFLFWGTGRPALIDWDENIYAEASRQMLLRGDYLNVYINGHLFSEKPPFFFWEQVLSYRLFGVNEFAARFPSAVAGVLMVILLYFVGCRIASTRLGLIWGAVYLTSLLPSVFGRAAVIDHTFNLFIAASAFFLYLFDIRFRQYIDRGAAPAGKAAPLRYHLIYLTLASICMGVATLTKGPLGGVIPLVAFAGHKFINRKPRIHLVHFLYCAVLSLSNGFSWYLANWIVTGDSFIEGFIRFQLALFSKTLEGHHGPFFYHFVVAFFGLLPWTPFLFAHKPGRLIREYQSLRSLFSFSVAWVVFVLVLFSFVSTKLPHYSASIYIPLSLVAALNLDYAISGNRSLSWWVIGLFTLAGITLAILIMAIPPLMTRFAQTQAIDFDHTWSNWLYFWGAGMIVSIVTAGVLLFRKKFAKSIVLTLIFMTLFTQVFWRFHIPPFLRINQEPLLEMVQEAQQKDGRLVFYRIVSFAAFFYGKTDIEVIHNYKFPGNPEILNRRHEKDLYIIADAENRERLLREHPLVEFLRAEGKFALFILEKRQGD